MDAAGISVLSSAVAVSKDNTYGAAFVGLAASSTCVTDRASYPNPAVNGGFSRLFGIVCSQTFTYLRRYPLDRMFYKILVRNVCA